MAEIYVIRWQIDGGRNSCDYRGRTTRDISFLQNSDPFGWTSRKSEAKQFSNVEEAVQYAIDRYNRNTPGEHKFTRYEEKGKVVLDYGRTESDIKYDKGPYRYLIERYRPRSKT